MESFYTFIFKHFNFDIPLPTLAFTQTSTDCASGAVVGVSGQDVGSEGTGGKWHNKLDKIQRDTNHSNCNVHCEEMCWHRVQNIKIKLTPTHTHHHHHTHCFHKYPVHPRLGTCTSHPHTQTVHIPWRAINPEDLNMWAVLKHEHAFHFKAVLHADTGRQWK